jgi:DNA-binding response OmpR family regulator
VSLLLQPLYEPAALKTVVSVSPIEQDQRDLRAILSECHAPVHSVSTMEDTLRSLIRGPIPLIVCDRDLPDGNWKALFQQTETLPCPPRFIVSSRLADEHLWIEVLNLGGQDVLRTPFVAREVRHAVESAWNAWQLQWAPAIKRRDVPRAAWPGAVEHLVKRKCAG